MDANVSEQTNQPFNGIRFAAAALDSVRPAQKQPAEISTESTSPADFKDEDVIQNNGNFEEN